METEKEFGTRQKIVSGIYDFLETVIIALIGIFILTVFIGRTVGVSGSSMVPTLNLDVFRYERAENGHNNAAPPPNDRLIITNFNFKPKYMDIIVEVQSNPRNQPLIKRVIATEGQTIEFNQEEHKIYVDGQPLYEPYIYESMNQDRFNITLPDGERVNKITVPKGKVFVMGDNRNDSLDSRFNEVGFIDDRYLLGKVVCRIYPLGKWEVK